jgi:hypothetical protein
MVIEQLFPVPQTVTTSDDYYTPPHIFERLGLTFDLDVCAPPGGYLGFRPRATTRKRRTRSSRLGKVESG